MDSCQLREKNYFALITKKSAHNDVTFEKNSYLCTVVS